MRAGHGVLLILSALALFALGVWLSLAYWAWGLVPLAGIVYVAAVLVTARLIVETFREIFGDVTLD